jgi:small GTP-binding protein
MATQENDNKLIILGLSESGKSTIVKSFTEGHLSSREGTYSATINYERKKHTFLGKELTVFDLGGQQSFIDRFTGSLAEFIFSDVKALIYVIDVSKFEEISRSKYYLDLSVINIKKYSPSCLKYIFIHKVDLLQEELLPEITDRFTEFLLEEYDKNEFKVYATSVYHDSVYTALGEVFSELSDIKTSIDPIIFNFIEQNKANLLFGGLVTRKGTQLTSSKLFPKEIPIAYSSAVIISDEYVRHIFKSTADPTSLITIDQEKKVSFIKYLKNDLALLVGFKKDEDSNIQTLIPRINIFANMLEGVLDKAT